MKKVCCDRVTVGVSLQNFSETVKSFIANDKTYPFMNIVKCTSAYWKHFLFEVVLIVKQLRLPTFSKTLS